MKSPFKKFLIFNFLKLPNLLDLHPILIHAVVLAAPTHLLAAGPQAQPLEPILFPKLRIYIADFPYPHYSKQLEATHLGDLMRL